MAQEKHKRYKGFPTQYIIACCDRERNAVLLISFSFKVCIAISVMNLSFELFLPLYLNLLPHT